MTDFINKVFRGDCRDILPVMIEAGVKVDFVLCDLPFGTSACKWDAVIPFDVMWKLLKEIAKPEATICLFGSEPFSSMLRCSNMSMYKYDWKWEKPSGANFLNFKYQPAKVHEDIMIFSNLPSSYTKKGNMMYYVPQMESGDPYTVPISIENYRNCLYLFESLMRFS